jgi:hypothetical protein
MFGRFKHQCKERYRLVDTVVELTFVFLCVSLRDSPFLRSSHFLTKGTESTDSVHYSTPVSKLTYLSVYDNRDGVSERTTSPSSPSSLTHLQIMYIGSRNPTRQTLSTFVKLTYLSVYDNRDGVSDQADSPLSPSSLTQVHRYIGSHNPTRQTLTTSVKQTYLSMYDNRNNTTQCMRGVKNPQLLFLSLSSHRSPYISLVFNSRFLDIHYKNISLEL